MGHAEHFLSRLNRLDADQEELALALYRDPPLVREVIAAAEVPEGVSRVALALTRDPSAPHILVERDGAFVTCLGPMLHNLPGALTAPEALDAFLLESSRCRLWSSPLQTRWASAEHILRGAPTQAPRRPMRGVVGEARSSPTRKDTTMIRMTRLLAIAPLAAALSLAGCITTSSHQKQMDDLKAQDQKTLDDAKADLGKQLDACNASSADLAAKLKDAQSRADSLNSLLGSTSADKDKLSQLLAASSSQLAELNKQKAAADARAATYKSLTDKLRGMIDSGKLKVIIRNGRMLISLPNDVLFASGSAELKKAGQDAIAQVASVLVSFSDRQFLVAGHTDDQAIHTARFPSNWELSTARAVDVTRFLIEHGMKPQQLGAVGYGEFDPVAPNDSAANRALNRRIEIQLQPNLSDLPSLEGIGAPAAK